MKQILVFVLLLSPGLILAQEENILSPTDTIPGQNININVSPKTNFTLGGAVWLRSAFQNWIQENQANQRGFYFDQFRLSISGEHGLAKKAKLKFSAQVRWWSYQFAVHHMWFGVQFNEHNELRYGITNTPFGAMPSISSSFWYSLNYYIGMESDHDAGLHYIFNKEGLNLQFAYFRNEEYNNPTATNRWAPDLIIDGDQQNFERNQLNGRLAYKFGYNTEFSSEFGISGEIGQIKNQLMRDNGRRWAFALHYVGNYRNWNPYAQVVRYEFLPNNPDSVDNRTVLMGFFSDQRLIAAKATTFTGGIRKHWNIDWWLFDKLNAYLEYSTIIKDENAFNDSRLINPGAVIQAGPFYIWTDLLVGQNAWWFNDSQDNSGLGAGAGNNNDWEFRYNFSLQWYF
jgi:hypothetical protein